MTSTTRKLAQEALDAMFPSLPLFMQMTPPHNGTPTSREAAHSVKPRVSKLRADVLVVLIARGEIGATAQEIEKATGLPGNTVRPRLVELRENGCVRDSGRKRKTDSGRLAVVWEYASR